MKHHKGSSVTHHIIQPTDPLGTREFPEAPIHCDGLIMGLLLLATWAGIIARSASKLEAAETTSGGSM